MALIRCSECNKEVSDLASACPGCGAPVVKPANPPPQPKSIGQKNVGCGTLILVAIGLLILFVAFVNITNPEDPAVRAERQNASSAIDLCWQNYERRSLDPGTKRFVAMTCEKMESDFKQKYRRDP